MSKKDVRVVENEKRIRKAYYKLVKKVPLNKITVTELCEEAQINRGTFYNHYIDIYDLSEKIENETLEKFRQMIEENLRTKGGRKGCIAAVLKKATKSEFTDRLLNVNSGNDSFMKKLSDECSIMFLGSMEQYMDGSMSDVEKNMYYHYISGGSGAIIRYWFESGMTESPDHIADLIIKLTDNTTQMLIGESR